MRVSLSMKPRAVVTRLVLSLVSAACTHRQSHPGPDPAALATLHADLRVVGGETTWVAHGQGYELVGRTRTDIIAVKPSLDRESALLARIFPGDSLARVVVKLRRAQPTGKPFIMAAPIPTTTRGAVVEVVLPDLTPRKDDAERRGPPGFATTGALSTYGPTGPVMRAWLSAHTSTLTKEPAHLLQATGEVDDPRVPAWAESLIPALDADSIVDWFTTMLAARPEAIIPLGTYFTMPRPEAASPSVAEQGGERGDGANGQSGGSRGGASGRSHSERPILGFSGLALFDAQSAVLGQFLSREGFDLIGALVDTQIRGSSLDELLTTRTGRTVEQMNVDWRQWLTNRAAALRR